MQARWVGAALRRLHPVRVVESGLSPESNLRKDRWVAVRSGPGVESKQGQ